MTQADLIWTFVSFSLTILVLSYLLGDNPFFRFAISLFIGVAAGYVMVITLYQVFWPKLFLPLLIGNWTERLLGIVPLILVILLFTKLNQRLSRLGTIPMAYLVGVAAALAIGGAVKGTLFPQALASINLFDLQAASTRGASAIPQLIEGVFILGGTVATLLYFYFGASQKPERLGKRSPVIEIPAQIGQIFIAITLGALFAGVYAASLTAMAERLNTLVNSIFKMFF
mgnify:CR=1 FL=1